MIKRHNIVLVTCARWETDTISEWLIYHRNIGFDRVYLYCNDDDPQPLYEKILPFNAPGREFVEFFHYGLQGHQREMYTHFLKNHVDECNWFLFLDVDEFLVLRNFRRIEDFVESFAQTPGSVYFFWRPAGSNGFVQRPIGPVLPRYTKCVNEISPFSKVLSRRTALSPSMLSAAGAPGSVFWHNMEPLMDTSVPLIDVLGNPVRGWYDNFPHGEASRANNFDYVAAILAEGFLYHISFKSEEDFARRLRRGTGGQFDGQAGWGRLADQGRVAIKEYLARHNVVDEQHLAGKWGEIMNGAASRQIIKPPPGPNIAIRKKATQSSISRWSIGSNCDADAAGLVDGRPNGRHHHHTEVEVEPWWQIDLEHLYQLSEVRIFNRLDNVGDRFRNFCLLWSADAINWHILFEKTDNQAFGGVDGNVFTLVGEFRHPCRYLKIVGKGESCIDLDQFEVYGSIAEGC